MHTQTLTHIFKIQQVWEQLNGKLDKLSAK